jgi:CHAD domain-containing protein
LVPVMAAPGSRPRAGAADRRAAAGLATLVAASGDAWLQAAAEAWQQDSPGNVHRLRVATRRLRAALTLCAGSVDRRLLRRLRRALRRPFRRAGRLRDLHVAGRLLNRYRARHPAVGATLLAIRAASDGRRQRLHRSLRPSRCQRLARRLGDIVAALRALARSTPASRGTVARLQRQVARLAGTFRAEAASAAATGAPEDLHRARIALKRLRYSDELAAELLPGPYAEAAARLRPLQQRLGGVVDLGLAAALAPPRLRRSLLAAQRKAAAAALPILAAKAAAAAG